MVTVMQVDRYLGVAERVVAVGRRAVPEPNDVGFAISTNDGWTWIPTIESPDIGRTEVGVECMQAGPGFQFGSHVGWRELSPALVVCTVPFTCAGVGCLSWLWI
jgi:hypothetical protein